MNTFSFLMHVRLLSWSEQSAMHYISLLITQSVSQFSLSVNFVLVGKIASCLHGLCQPRYCSDVGKSKKIKVERKSSICGISTFLKLLNTRTAFESMLTRIAFARHTTKDLRLKVPRKSRLSTCSSLGLILTYHDLPIHQTRRMIFGGPQFWTRSTRACWSYHSAAALIMCLGIYSIILMLFANRFFTLLSFPSCLFGDISYVFRYFRLWITLRRRPIILEAA